MVGIVYGDLIGSVYKAREFASHDKELMIKASKYPDLLSSNSFISDETIIAMASSDAIKNNLDYMQTLKEYILNNPKYFNEAFNTDVAKWASGVIKHVDTASFLAGVDSIASLRKNYIAICNDIILSSSKVVSDASAIKAPLSLATLIYLAKSHYSKGEIKKIIDTFFPTQYDFELNELRENMHYTDSADEILAIALYVIFNTDSFEDAMRLSLSLGGNTDTLCAVVGGVAEALYGVPSQIEAKVQSYVPQIKLV